MPSAHEVLDALDHACEALALPVLDNVNIDYLASRMTAYLDGDRWAVVFNSVAWSGGANAVIACVDPVGSAIGMSTWTAFLGQREQELAPMQQRAESLVERLLSGAAPTTMSDVERQLRGNAATIAQWAETYRRDAAAGPLASEQDKTITVAELDFNDDHAQPGSIAAFTGARVRGRFVPATALHPRPEPRLHADAGFWLGRALVEHDPAALFASDDEVAKFFPGGLPPPFLGVDRWRHPHVSAGEKASDLQTFKLLARAMEARDAGLFAPTEKANNDWRGWLPK